MSLDAVQANISLHHLEVKSREPEKLAKFYSNVMNMKITRLNNQKFLCEGPSRKIIMSTGKNKTFGYAGMICKNKCVFFFQKDWLKRQSKK